MSQRQSGGLESAAIRRAWVSGDPAGMSQRRAGGHWVRGGPVAWSPANGAPGGAATQELGKPTSGLGRATAGGYLTRGDPAELPRHLAVGYGGIMSGDFLAAEQTEQEQNKRLLKKTENKTGWRGAAYG